MRGVHEGPRVGERAELGIDLRVIADRVIAAQRAFAVDDADRLDGHDPEDVDAEAVEPREVSLQRRERSLGCVLADVHFIEDGGARPLGGRRGDDDRRRGRHLTVGTRIQCEREGNDAGPYSVLHFAKA